jgi:hypothetical protein
MLAALQL